MITFEPKIKSRTTFSYIQIVVILLTLLTLLQAQVVQAYQTESIQTMDLDLSAGDIARVEFGYHHSSFESQHIEYNLDVEADVLTDGNVKAPLSSLTPLLSGLKGMYPGTQPLIWQMWTDDYPHAWVYLYLNDGRVVQILSDSQFDGMFPWNVSLWNSEKATQPDAVYIQLNTTLLDGLDVLWRGVGEEGFPRGRYSESFWKDMFGNAASETAEFNTYSQYLPDMDNSDTAPVWGATPAALTPFIPELSRNAEIKTLLDAGYHLYDAAFTLEVQTRTLKPVQYHGTLALAAPDGKDVVIGLVTLPLADEQPVTTTLNATESMHLVEQRRASPFLNKASQILTHLTFLLDTRTGTDIPTLDCPESRDISLDGQIIQAIWNPAQPMRITFFPLTDQRWSVDLGVQRGDPNWNDTRVQTILQSWFPEPIAALPVQDLQAFDSSWKLAFQPDVTLHDLQLLDRLASGLPEQTVVHEQNPEKAGDYSFLSLEGRVVISENGTAPVVVHCGVTLPDWYSPAYPIKDVVPPNDQAPRQNITVTRTREWLSLIGSLPHEQFRTNWTDIAFTQPGFLHVLWTDEREGVYYADGWMDGTGWSEPQRLGDDAYWLRIRAWPDGEVHLFWDTGLTTKGSIHVWRPAGGDWQKPEHWPIAYYGEMVRDLNGVLHIGAIESDGLDGEFMHRTWSPEKGLSDPENISRQVGNTGNSTAHLRIDSKGRLHAAWSHILEEKSAPDPITGETSDISGVFYAYQLSDGRWSKPELIGTLAAYAHAMSMELDPGDEPLIVWQANNGLFSRIKKNGIWADPVELAKVVPPETPAEFGPERWVQPTVELQTGVDTQGQIVTAWLNPSSGLKLAFWSDTGWTGIVDIVTIKDNSSIELYPPALQMVVDDHNDVHFVFFENSVVNYAIYDHKQVGINPLSMKYDGYGLPEASLLVDTAGSVAVLGLPRSPGFDVKIPPEGIPPTPTLEPTVIPLPTSIPQNTLTPSQTLTKNSGLVPVMIGLGILLIAIAIGMAVRRIKKNS